MRYWYLRRVVGGALRMAGPRAAEGVARWAAHGIHRQCGPGRRRAEARIARWFGSDANRETVERISRGMYEHAGRFWAESLFISRRMRADMWRRYVEVHDEGAWRQLADARRGCLIATPCFGNVGVLACVLGQLFRPIHVVVDILHQPLLRAWQADLYRAEWVSPIDRAQAGRALPSLLERGGAVMMLADAERAHGLACDVSFLGEMIRAYPTIPRLTKMFGASIVAATCTRRASGFHFDLRLDGHWAAGECRNETALMQQIMDRLEAAVAQCPEQYFWATPTLAASSARGAIVGAAAVRLASTVGADQAYGNLIGVVPHIRSNSDGVAKAVSGGQRAGRSGVGS